MNKRNLLIAGLAGVVAISSLTGCAVRQRHPQTRVSQGVQECWNGQTYIDCALLESQGYLSPGVAPVDPYYDPYYGGGAPMVQHHHHMTPVFIPGPYHSSSGVAHPAPRLRATGVAPRFKTVSPMSGGFKRTYVSSPTFSRPSFSSSRPSFSFSSASSRPSSSFRSFSSGSSFGSSGRSFSFSRGR